jgi:hypothetical protein
VAGSCKCVNELSGSVKCGEFPNIAAWLMPLSGLYIYHGLFLWRSSPWCVCPSSVSILHDRTQTHYIRYDSSGRVISSNQGPLSNNTQHSQGIVTKLLIVIFRVNDQLDAQLRCITQYVYCYDPLHVWSNSVLVIRRSNCINTASGIVIIIIIIIIINIKDRTL